MLLKAQHEYITNTEDNIVIHRSMKICYKLHVYNKKNTNKNNVSRNDVYFLRFKNTYIPHSFFE